MLRYFHIALALMLCFCNVPAIAESSGLWLDVPFVKQEKNGCGAASIAMVMQYWMLQQGRPQSPNADAIQIQRALYSGHARGIYASDLEGYLQQEGFRTFALRGEWTDLKQQLEKGRPLIVALKPDSQNPAQLVNRRGFSAGTPVRAFIRVSQKLHIQALGSGSSSE